MLGTRFLTVLLLTAFFGSNSFADDPIHYDKKIAGVGLARSFAIELAGIDEKVTIGLVPAACGGSAIAAWEPGAYCDKTDSHPYDDAIARTRRTTRTSIPNRCMSSAVAMPKPTCRSG